MREKKERNGMAHLSFNETPQNKQTNKKLN